MVIRFVGYLTVALAGKVLLGTGNTEYGRILARFAGFRGSCGILTMSEDRTSLGAGVVLEKGTDCPSQVLSAAGSSEVAQGKVAWLYVSTP